MRHLLITALCFPGVAWAQANVRVTQTTSLEYRDQSPDPARPDDRYGVLVERLNVVGSAGGITTNARVDATGFVGAPADNFSNDARLERMSVRYALDEWTVVGGDYFKQLGRGLALSIRKVDELGVDMTIQGGEVGYKSRTHHASVFGGRVNLANFDPISQRFIEDKDDKLVGASYAYRGLSFAELGAFTVYVEPTESVVESLGHDQSRTVGGYIDIPEVFGGLTMYAEGDHQDRCFAGASDTGDAGFVSLMWASEDFSVLVEGLYLDNFFQMGSQNTATLSRFSYNQAPTLERLDQEVTNNHDVRGGRVRLEQFFMDGDLMLHQNAMFRRMAPGEVGETDATHAFGGVELSYQRGRSRVAVEGGWRDEQVDGESIKSMTHGELDVVQAINGPMSLHLSGNVELRTLEDEDYVQGSSFVGLDWAGEGSLTFEFGYNTKNQLGKDDYFYAAIAAYEATDWLQMRSTVGTQRGGLKCVGGVCRDFPEFHGARLDLVGRHDLGG